MMPVQMRPYYVVHNGVEHMVEAPNPAKAVAHVVGTAVTELRPARGSEVTAWMRANKPLEVAGQKPASAAPAGVAQEAAVDAAFTADDALAWLIQHEAKPLTIAAFSSIRSQNRMTLEQFDIARQGCPAFEKAIVETIGGVTADGPGMDADDIRAHLEDSPMTLEVVIGCIAEAKRDENFEPVADPDTAAAE